MKLGLSETEAQTHRRGPSKGFTDQSAAHSDTLDPNPPGGWAVLAAAGVDDWLVVIETAKGKFLPDGLSLIPLGLPEKEGKKYTNMRMSDKSACFSRSCIYIRILSGNAGWEEENEGKTGERGAKKGFSASYRLK